LQIRKFLRMPSTGFAGGLKFFLKFETLILGLTLNPPLNTGSENVLHTCA
jgi:hypothetical protein